MRRFLLVLHPGVLRVVERLLTARELAETLGFQAGTILDWFEDGKLPGFRVNGRAVRFRESEVEAWLMAQRVGPSIRPVEVL